MTDAKITMVDGKPVLEDPFALAAFKAIGKHNCRGIYELSAERISHFKKRAKELVRTDLAIVIINVDDPHGGPIADVLMPGVNWQEFRDRGEIPVARGLVIRSGIEQIIALFDPDAADKINDAVEIPVVVVDCGTVEVFEE